MKAAVQQPSHGGARAFSWLGSEHNGDQFLARLAVHDWANQLLGAVNSQIPQFAGSPAPEFNFLQETPGWMMQTNRPGASFNSGPDGTISIGSGWLQALANAKASNHMTVEAELPHELAHIHQTDEAYGVPNDWNAAPLREGAAQAFALNNLAAVRRADPSFDTAVNPDVYRAWAAQVAAQRGPGWVEYGQFGLPVPATNQTLQRLAATAQPPSPLARLMAERQTPK